MSHDVSKVKPEVLTNGSVPWKQGLSTEDCIKWIEQGKDQTDRRYAVILASTARYIIKENRYCGKF